MKLFVRLFYVLLAIFVSGIVILFLFEPSSVMSRVATGLVTGSFVGLINSLTNYYHLRQTYFEKLVVSITDVSQALERDYTHALARNKFIKDTPQKQMIKFAAEHEKVLVNHKHIEEMEAKYEALISKFDFEAFVSLWPFVDKKLKGVLEELEMLLFSNVKHLHGVYMTCFDFTLLSAKVSKKEQEITLGDPNMFYEFAIQNNIDYRDLLAHYLNVLADLASKLVHLGKRYLSKMYRDLLEGNVHIIRSVYLKDVSIRDVIERIGTIDDNGGKDDQS